MSIDWELLGKLGIPALATLLVALLKQATEHRPHLIAYFSSVSAFPFSGNADDRGSDATASAESASRPTSYNSDRT